MNYLNTRRNLIFGFVGALLLSTFQNCSSKMQFFSESMTSFTTSVDSETQSTIPDNTLNSEFENLDLSEKIDIQIADSYSQDIVLREAQIRAVGSQRITQEIYLAPFKIKRASNFNKDILSVNIKVQLIKQIITSDSVAFPQAVGFGGFSIAANQVPSNGLNISVPVTADGWVHNPHDFRIDLRGFLIENDLAYGTGYFKIDYSFPEIEFKKSIIVALSAYKESQVINGLPAQIILGAGTQKTLRSEQEIEVCKLDSKDFVRWESQNSADYCQAANIFYMEQVSYGIENRNYLPLGSSIQVRGSNTLKFLSSGTTTGTAVLKCTSEGLKLESATCINHAIYDPAEIPTRHVENLEEQARAYEASARETIERYTRQGDVSPAVIDGIKAEVVRKNQLAQEARAALPAIIRNARKSYDPNQGVKAILAGLSTLVHQ